MILEYSCSNNSELFPIMNESISFMHETESCSAIEELVIKNLLLNEKLLNSLEVLNSHLLMQENRSFWFTPYIPLFAVLLGTFAAYLFTGRHWKYSEAKKKESEFVDKISNLVDEIEEFSVAYWLADYSEKDSENEVYIKSRIRLLSRYIRVIDEKKEPLKSALAEFQSDIFDLVTGEEFESLRRKASKPKAIRISYKCGDINATLSSHR
jgi:hypothetical protein